MVFRAHSIRSMLMVGPFAEDDIAAALMSEASAVCIDLEDAVPPLRKDDGRKATAALLAKLSRENPRIVLRVNPVRSIVGVHDILACLDGFDNVQGLLLPKVDRKEDVLWVSDLLDEAGLDLEIHAIIETNDGLHNCHSIACASPRLTGLVFGGFDLSTALGCAMDWETLLHARSRTVHAAATAGVGVLDSPHVSVDDLDGVRTTTERSRRLGMTGRIVKQASHVPVVNAIYRPTDTEIQQARSILSNFEANGGQSILFEGCLIELPSIKSIRRIAECRLSSE